MFKQSDNSIPNLVQKERQREWKSDDTLRWCSTTLLGEDKDIINEDINNKMILRVDGPKPYSDLYYKHPPIVYNDINPDEYLTSSYFQSGITHGVFSGKFKSTKIID